MVLMIIGICGLVKPCPGSSAFPCTGVSSRLRVLLGRVALGHLLHFASCLLIENSVSGSHKVLDDGLIG